MCIYSAFNSTNLVNICMNISKFGFSYKKFRRHSKQQRWWPSGLVNGEGNYKYTKKNCWGYFHLSIILRLQKFRMIWTLYVQANITTIPSLLIIINTSPHILNLHKDTIPLIYWSMQLVTLDRALWYSSEVVHWQSSGHYFWSIPTMLGP